MMEEFISEVQVTRMPTKLQYIGEMTQYNRFSAVSEVSLQ